jgi:hypothetical protein
LPSTEVLLPLTRRFVALVLSATAVVGLFVGMGIGVFQSKPFEPATTADSGRPLPDASAQVPPPSPTQPPTPGPARDRTYVVTNLLEQTVADVLGGSDGDGTPVILFEANGQNNQRWKVEDAGDGLASLVSEDSGKCLQARNRSRQRNAVAVIAECDDGDTAQRWQFSQRGKGWRLTNERSGLVLDASDRQIAGTRVIVQKEPGDDQRSQVWLFTPAS